MACCCATSEVIEHWDLPMEPEHSMPLRMSNIKQHTLPPEAEELEVPEDSSQFTVGPVDVSAGESQGLALLHADKANKVIVCGVASGPWSIWNEAHPEKALRPSDQIIEVNGKRNGDICIMDEMAVKTTMSRKVSMMVRRPSEYRIIVSKQEGEALGLVLVPSEKGLLFIDGVSAEGAVQRWNTANADRKVTALDRIVEVNRCRGNSTELVHAMRQEGDCELLLEAHLG